MNCESIHALPFPPLTVSSAWIPNTDLSPITPEECANVPEKGKAKALVEGYKVAAAGHDLDHFKEILLAHDAAMQEDIAVKAEKEAEKAAKSDKKKRKSEVKATEDVEMEDAAEAPKKSSKKRKKDAESEDEEQPEKVRSLAMCVLFSTN